MHRRSGQVDHTDGERGASLVEYALLLALIAVVCLSAVTFFGNATSSNITKSNDCIEAAANGLAPPAGCP